MCYFSGLFDYAFFSLTKLPNQVSLRERLGGWGVFFPHKEFTPEIHIPNPAALIQTPPKRAITDTSAPRTRSNVSAVLVSITLPSSNFASATAVFPGAVSTLTIRLSVPSGLVRSMGV
jgi:hypothetical protein